MLALDAITKSIELKLNGAVATSELPFIANYVDIDQAALGLTASAEVDGLSTGAVAVTVVAAPGGATTRKLNYLSVFNIDTAPAKVTIQINNGGTKRVTFCATLAVGDTLGYVDGRGFYVLDATGQTRITGATGPTGAIGPIGFGLQGYDGEDGIDGFQGMPGATGAAGAGGGSLSFIGQGEGTNATAAATTIFTQVLPALAVKDRVLIYLTLSALTQLTNIPVLYHVTDAAQIAQLNNGNTLAAGQFTEHHIVIACDQSSANSYVERHNGGTASTGTPGVGFSTANLYAATAAFTSGWSVGIRTGVGGVVAGGTLRYRVEVYKLQG